VSRRKKNHPRRRLWRTWASSAKTNTMDDVEIIDVNEDGEEMPAVVARRAVEHRELENQDLGFLRRAGTSPGPPSTVHYTTLHYTTVQYSLYSAPGGVFLWWWCWTPGLLGPCWLYAGALLALCWGPAGSMLGPWWLYAGALMALCWGPDGSMLGLWWLYAGAVVALCWGPALYPGGSMLGPCCALPRQLLSRHYDPDWLPGSGQQSDYNNIEYIYPPQYWMTDAHNDWITELLVSEPQPGKIR